MPIVVKLSPVAPAIGLAQNVGNFATGQAQQEQALQVGEFQQRQQQQQFQQQQQTQHYADQQQAGDEELQFKYAQLDAMNQRAAAGIDGRFQLADQRGQQQQELQNLRNLAATGNLDQRGQQRMAQILAQGDLNQQRDQQRQTFQGGQNDANRASREYVGETNNDTRIRGQDLQNGLGYDQIDAANQRALDAQQGRMDLSQFNTQQQDQRRATERDYRGQTATTRAQIQELVRQRNILEARGRGGDSSAAARIYEITGQINQLNQPAPTPQVTPNFQSGADLYQPTAGQVGGVPFDASSYLPPGGAGGGGQGDDIGGLADQIGSAVRGGVQPPVQIASEQDYQALPPGTPYVAPDGSVRMKRR